MPNSSTPRDAAQVRRRALLEHTVPTIAAAAAQSALDLIECCSEDVEVRLEAARQTARLLQAGILARAQDRER